MKTEALVWCQWKVTSGWAGWCGGWPNHSGKWTLFKTYLPKYSHCCYLFTVFFSLLRFSLGSCFVFINKVSQAGLKKKKPHAHTRTHTQGKRSVHWKQDWQTPLAEKFPSHCNYVIVYFTIHILIWLPPCQSRAEGPSQGDAFSCHLDNKKQMSQLGKIAWPFTVLQHLAFHAAWPRLLCDIYLLSTVRCPHSVPTPPSRSHLLLAPCLLSVLLYLSLSLHRSLSLSCC